MLPTTLDEDEKSGLTPLQAACVMEYLVDFQRIPAERRAREKVGQEIPKPTGSVFKSKKVQKAIEDALRERAGVSEARLVDELAEIAFSNITDFVSFSEDHVTILDSSLLSKAKTRAIKSVKMTQHGLAIEMHSKLEAIEKLARAYPSFSNKKEISGPNGAPLFQPVLMVYNKDRETPDEARVASIIESRIASAKDDEEDDEGIEEAVLLDEDGNLG